MELPVQGTLDFHDHICMRWKIGFDVDLVAFRSRTVIFRKSELTLRLVKPHAAALLTVQLRAEPLLQGTFEIECFILARNGSKCYTQNSFVTSLSPYTQVWSIETKLVYCNKANLVTNGCFDFVCIINFIAQRCFGKQIEVPKTIDSSLEKLSDDVSKLYKSSEYSDISLKCGDITIPAHKFLLSTRSDVFAAIFKSDMVECQQGFIDIPDIEPDVLDHLLKYMYTGKMADLPTDTAIQLYAAADKYGVLSLMIKCRAVISSSLTADNATDVLVLSDAHSDEDLKKHVLLYLQNDRDFILSDKWKMFSKARPDLAVEAYDFYVRGMMNK